MVDLTAHPPVGGGGALETLGAATGEPPSRGARAAVALLLGLAALAYAAYLSVTMPPSWVTDFDPIWAGSRELLRGRNPYVLGAVALRSPYGLYYPLPALIATLPLAALPLQAARALFVGASTALCAWALFRRDWTRWPLFVSMSFVQTVVIAQWAPLLLFAALTPVAAGLLLAKPNIGAALGLCEYALPAVPDRRRLAVACLSAGLMLALSFALFGGWVSAWAGAIHDTAFMRPAVLRWRFGGPLLLLALLRWRQPDARLLLALAAVPQTPGVWEGVALFLIARTTRQALWLAVLSYVGYIVGGLAWGYLSRNVGDCATRGPVCATAYFRVSGAAALWSLYVPCLAIVLSRRDQGAPASPAALRQRGAS